MFATRRSVGDSDRRSPRASRLPPRRHGVGGDATNGLHFDMDCDPCLRETRAIKSHHRTSSFSTRDRCTRLSVVTRSAGRKGRGLGSIASRLPFRRVPGCSTLALPEGCPPHPDACLLAGDSEEEAVTKRDGVALPRSTFLTAGRSARWGRPLPARGVRAAPRLLPAGRRAMPPASSVASGRAAAERLAPQDAERSGRGGP